MVRLGQWQLINDLASFSSPTEPPPACRTDVPMTALLNDLPVHATDVMAAAEAILTVANAKMAGAIRVVSIERGHDPRAFAYMPFGGGGALHVCAMMREVGVGTGIVPRYPGVTSALGCVMADMRHDAVQTLNKALPELDITDLRQRIADVGFEIPAPDQRTPEALAAFHKAETGKWWPIIKAANIKAE